MRKSPDHTLSRLFSKIATFICCWWRRRDSNPRPRWVILGVYECIRQLSLMSHMPIGRLITTPVHPEFRHQRGEHSMKAIRHNTRPRIHTAERCGSDGCLFRQRERNCYWLLLFLPLLTRPAAPRLASVTRPHPVNTTRPHLGKRHQCFAVAGILL